MSESDDYPIEMPRTAMLDELTIAAILDGEAGAEHHALSTFVAEMRSVSTGPAPQPSPSLSSLFLHGLSTENGDLSATAASNVTGPAPQAAGLPKWRKYSMAVKQFLAGLSIAGKLALGAGMAAAATTGAGTAGVLPDSVQHQFARAFDTVTPFEVSDPAPPSVLGAPAPHEPAQPHEQTFTAREIEPTTTKAPPPPSTTAVEAPRPTEPTRTEPAHDREPAPVLPAPTTTEVRHEPTTTVKEPEHPVTTTRPPETPVPVTLSIACTQNAAALSVNCAWTVLTPTETVSYALLRVGSDASRVILETRDLTTSSFVDIHVDAGHTYSYMIVARKATGQTIGHSMYVPVSVVAR